MTDVQLLSRVIISANILTKTGLHIGGSAGGLTIGGVDMPVIRNALNNEPYIPGSSLKGKLRSLAEKWSGAPQNKSIGKGVNMHVAGGESKDPQIGASDYAKYWVNPLFGVPGEVKFEVNAPNRLIIRDVMLDKDSKAELLRLKTDLPFTEVKWEAAIDRVTSAATPRQIERVPAGTVFGPMEMIMSIYLKEDIKLLGNLFTALQLLEDDYLGGQGSRGSGKIEFISLNIKIRSGVDYAQVDGEGKSFENLPQLITHKKEILDWVSRNLPA
jgi:CRISPR-associated protein Csm3